MSSTGSYEAAVATQRRPGLEGRDGSLHPRELVRLGTLAASSHNTQPWKFQLQDRSLTLWPDFSRRCAVVDPDDGHLFKSLGCAAENIVHAAAAQGHAAEVSFDAGARVVRIAFEPSRAVRATPLFHAIPHRQCSRRSYTGKPLPPTVMAALEQAGSGDGVRTLLIEDRAVRDAIVDYVRESDIAQLSDPAFRKELIAWLRFNDAAALRTGDGLAGRVTGQPAIPDWLAQVIIPFVLTGKAQAQVDATNIRSAPMIAVFVATRETPAAWLEVGRVYERFALQTTALDVRTAFINQPIEVRHLRPGLNSLLGLDGETALLIVRVGYGPQAPFSLRRPVDDVILSD